MPTARPGRTVAGRLPAAAASPLAALALALAAAGCDAVAGMGVPDAHPLGERAGEWTSLEADAQVAFARGDWSAARGALERKVALYPPIPDGGAASGTRADARRAETLRRLRGVDLYNLACARALAGEGRAALDVLATCLADDPDLVGVDHVLLDPDLSSLHGDPELAALLRAPGDAFEILPPPDTAAGPAPLAVLLVDGSAAADRDDARPVGNAPAGEAAAATADADAALARRLVAEGFRVVRVHAPWRSRDPRAAWLPRLAGGAAAAARAYEAWRAAETAAGARGASPPAILVASGPAAAPAAWEILLHEPSPFSAAVIDGPAPALEEILDREEALLGRGTRVIAVGASSLPPPPAGKAGLRIPVVVADGLDDALRRAVDGEGGAR